MDNYLINKEESQILKILKVLLTIFVVYIHSDLTRNGNMAFNEGNLLLELPKWLKTIEYFISSIICNCANNCFFLISSILLYRKNFVYLENIKKKIKSLIVPYIIANTIVVILYSIFSVFPYTKTFFSNNYFVGNDGFEIRKFLGLYGICSKGTLNGPLWFLRNLFVLNVLSIPIKKLIDKFPRITIIILIINAIMNKYNYFYLIYSDNLLFWCLGLYLVKYQIY